ncbi:MAG: hypothetical protein QXE31_04905 [Candidatus Woesearchaeota archaeon]
MDYRDYLINKFKNYSLNPIIISKHTEIRLIQRDINKKDIIENILNPTRLKIAIRQESLRKSEEKFDCYFKYKKNFYHRYIIALNSNIIIITAMIIRRRLKKFFENET